MASWPPAPLQTVHNKQAIWQAWVDGDLDTLGVSLSTHGNLGLWGKIRRFFMGTAGAPGPSTKYHVPIAANICRTSAELLFAEQVSIKAGPGANPRTADRLTELVDAMSLDTLLLQAAETAATKGGILARIAWGQAGPRIDFIDPTRVVLNGDDHITVVTRVHAARGKVWRHFETHTPGRITHSLYEGSEDRKGFEVPLTDLPATANLAVDEDGGMDTGTNLMTAVYIQNRPGNDGYGESDLAGVEHLLDAANETLSSLMRDIRISKAQLIAPQSALTSNGKGQGASYNLDPEVVAGINVPVDDFKITVNQFDIRVVEFAATDDLLARKIYEGAGYSPATFGLSDSVAVTATEVAAREKKTMVTRERKTRIWGRALVQILNALIEVDAYLYGGHPGDAQVVVDFPEVVNPTPQETATEISALRLAGVMSVESGVRRTNPGWTDEQVAAEVERIDFENGRQQVDPFDLPA